MPRSGPGLQAQGPEGIGNAFVCAPRTSYLRPRAWHLAGAQRVAVQEQVILGPLAPCRSCAIFHPVALVAGSWSLGMVVGLALHVLVGVVLSSRSWGPGPGLHMWVSAWPLGRCPSAGVRPGESGVWLGVMVTR